MKKLLNGLAVICTLIVCSCASVGSNFKDENISMLKAGSTTYTDACTILGSKPMTKNIVAGGTQATWLYTHAVYTSVTQNKSLTILFDENNVMKKVMTANNIDIPPSQRKQLGL